MIQALQTCGRYILYNDTQLTTHKNMPSMMFRCWLTTVVNVSTTVTLTRPRTLFGSAHLAMPPCAMTRSAFKILVTTVSSFVTRHWVIVLPASWSSSFGSAIRHWFSMINSVSKFRYRQAACSCIYVHTRHAASVDNPRGFASMSMRIR